jgi:hypothetical protein
MRTEKNTAMRRTHITIETQRLLIVKDHREVVRGWCEQCGTLVTLVTPEITAALTGLSRRAVYRLIETGQVHFTESPTESPEAPISVCLKSLTKMKS